ncbi:MAG: enoyl-CoA hydratase-related protein, partial [Alphaproteobacteria bacterium]|nr:enoyl-CoA hydratase-related protein [Alphaproteobacteria bacterium]
RGVTFTDALPLTASGKIRRFALRQAPQTATMAATTENSGGQGMSEARQVETAEAEILVDLQDGIGRITMNRPEHRNPLSLDFAALMNAALDRLEDDPDCRVIILTGNGPVFCGGAELGKVVVPGEVDGEWQYLVIRGVNRLVKRLRALDLPVIAAVNGPAVGGGASLALACDIAIAAPTASYYFAFGRVGASGADMGATYLLPRLVGTMRAAHLMLTGADVGAEEGRELGLFTEVVPADQLQATAETMAKQIIEAYPRRAAAMTKMSLFRGESTDLETCLEYEMFAQNYLFRGEEHRERLGAFLNRKK